MATKTLMTTKEFESLCLQGKLGHCELIDGEVIELAPGGNYHSITSLNIGGILRNFVLKHKLGRVMGNEAGIHIRDDLPRSRGADVVYISFKRIPRGKMPDGFLRTPPELIVEVVPADGSWRGMAEKVADYHSIGVDMVWIADPNTRTVKTYPRKGQPTIIHDGSSIKGGSILPGFSVPIASFFDEG
jgi:Uma2 family endonuclease